MRRALPFVVSLFLAAPGARAEAQPPEGSGPPPPPPARAVPGITAPDTQPQACVSCHVNMPEIGVDARLSTALARWREGVEPELLARVQATMPTDAELTGRHPAASSSLRDVPSGCIKCHRSGSGRTPAFAPMIHVLHLTGGEENHFLTIFQGECTHCHKLDPDTGAWSVPSGPEQEAPAAPPG